MYQSKLDRVTKHQWIKDNRIQWMQEYFTFLTFPSISSETQHAEDIVECADWLEKYLISLDFTTERWSTSGHPVLFATYEKAGPSKPTLLIYHHYDVQPVDPLSEWVTLPFEPTEREGNVYARGAQDNKGQCFYVLQALKMMQEQKGAYPINIKVCIEGEEEMGSVGLNQLLIEKKDALKADFLAVIDTGIRSEEVPAITLGMRGIVTFDVELQGAHVDLHSGTHGGVVVNSLHALVQLLAGLRNEKGQITIPDFYKEVQALSSEEQETFGGEFDLFHYEQVNGSPVGGEKEFSPLERAGCRPTLEINGISGGYAGEGFKTVIPAKAHAKLSCRLVPSQDPQVIGKLVAHYLESRAPEGTQVKVTIHPGGKAIRSKATTLIASCFRQALEEIFQKPCEFIFSGGSIPIVTALAEMSKSEVLLFGLGLDSDRIHAPNEHFSLKRLEQGILVINRVIELLGESSK